MRTKVVFLIAMTMLILSSCKEDEMDDMKEKGTFTLTIENVFEPKDFFESGTTEGIPPAENYSFKVNAGKGHLLTLIMMLGQSNDLFFGTSDAGLPLYDNDGNPVTGDITSNFYLWDAGTEVNEEPGAGQNQAPRQSGPNTGPDENGTVRMIGDVNDGFTYPAVNDFMKVVITHDGGTEFTITVSNQSDMIGLTSPLAPGVWVVHGSGSQLFTENQPASEALERQAEDGNNTELGNYAAMHAGYVSPIAPGVYAVYMGTNPVFQSGQQAGAALESLAEDADASAFDFSSNMEVADWGVYNTPESAGSPGPILPGQSYKVTFEATEGDYLTFASMLGQTNDLFLGAGGIALFGDGIAISGNITDQVKLWDAKTEVNQYPGAGNDQAPRQSGPDTGPEETGNVGLVNDGYTYPAISEMIRVTITSN